MKNNSFYFVLAFFLICFLIFGCVIFIEPIVGVADQGDFFRVFFGIEWPYPDFWSSGHFFKYVTPDYSFAPFPYQKMYEYPFEASQIYFVFLGRAVSRLMGLDHFSQYAYAVCCAAFYILGLTLIYAAVMPEKTSMRVLLGLGIILVFIDGRWLQWFNSLYGEPIVMIGIVLTVGMFLFIGNREKANVPLLLPFFMAEVVMVGGKLQAVSLFSTVLVLNGFMAFMIWRRKPAARLKLPLILLLTGLQMYYCVGLYNNPDGARANKDRVFQSMFTGVMANADNPQKVLEELGLDPEFVYDIGKTAYMPEDEYTFGAMHGDVMREKFFDKVNNNVIIKYYLTHPGEFFKGLLYLGQKTMTFASNGIHPEGYEYAIEHNRFAVWSHIRNRLPKNFAFLSLVLLASVVISIILFKRKQRAYAALIWALAAGGCIQFTLPYIFNGTCDTTKQLIVFNFILDTFFFILAAFGVSEIHRLFTYDSEDDCCEHPKKPPILKIVFNGAKER